MKNLFTKMLIPSAKAGAVRVVWAIALMLGSASGSLHAQDDKDAITFDDHIQPIFRQRCANCHHPDKKSGGLDLTNYTALMLGGSSGEAVDPGDAESSYLYMLVTHDQEPVMPPNSSKLPADELRLIKRWINQGVLETKTSTAVNKKKKTFDLSASGSALERPDVVAQPPRLPLEPVVETVNPPTAVPIAISPWAPLAAIGGAKQVLLYDLTSLELRGVLPFPEGLPRVVRFSRNGRILLAGGGTDASLGKVVLWDIASGERVAEIGDELDTILSADISADHSLVALGGPLKVVRVFRVATGELLYERRKHTDWVTGVSFSPDGVLLASADRSGNVFVWEAHTGNEYLTLRGHTQLVKELAWRWDSNLLATVSDDATIRWWELENGGQIKSLTAHAGGASWAVFNREGLMLSGGRDRLVKLWNATGDQQAQFTSASDLVACCAYCSETNRIVASDWLGNVWVWNSSDGTPLGQLSSNPPSLARRLADAQQASNEAHSVLSRAEGTFQESEQQFQGARESLSHGMESLSVHQTAVNQIEQALAAKQAVVQTKLAEQQAWQSELADKQRLVPELEILAAKAREVAEISADDPELVDAAQKLTDKLATTAARIDELTRLTSEAQSAQTELVGQIQQLGEQRDHERAELEKQQVLVAELQAELNQREATMMAHKTELDSAKQVADQAAATVIFWQEEIAFVSKLEQLHLELTEAERQIQEDVALRDAIAEELRQIQARLAEAEQAIRASTETANGIQQSLQTLQQPK